MSTIALYRDLDLRRSPAREPRRATRSAPRGILRRIFAALARSHDRRVEREAARFIASHGGRVTDDVERQLNAHFSGRPFLPCTLPRAFVPTANLLDW